MSFCGVCGRDHDPGPCPIPFVEPDSPNWESEQYNRVGKGTILIGVLIIVLSLFMPVVAGAFLAVGAITLVSGVAVYILAKKG